MKRADSSMHRAKQVLAGVMRVTRDELVALINAVNPTERALSRSEEQRRYEVKAALQSKLVVENPELIVVTADDAHTIGLALEGTGRQAGHAKLVALSDEARSIVQRKLDVPHVDAPAVAGDARPSVLRVSREPTDPVAAGDC